MPSPWRLLGGAAVALACLSIAASESQVSAKSRRPDSIIDLQPLREVSSVEFGSSQARGIARLTNLNPAINAWFVLELERTGAHELVRYHLENPDRLGTSVFLGEAGSGGLLLVSKQGRSLCALWAGAAESPLETARRSGLPFVPLCGNRLYLRNVVAGAYTRLERVTDFLRDYVWGGDQIVTFVRTHVFEDWYAEKGAESASPASADATSPGADSPQPGNVEPGREAAIIPEHLGIDLQGDAGTLLLGRWYGVKGVPGAFVSSMQPQAVAASVLTSFPKLVERLDAVEASAVDYLVAFDLAQFDLGFELGTDHPRLDWSGREPADMHDSSLPGPDGIANAAPLARSAMVSPNLVPRTVATFAGGFKREHSAFRYGALSRQNHGSHYGFIEEGVLFSTLQPGLATVYVLNDGTVKMKTWESADASELQDIRYARQNGVPLIEGAASSSLAPVPGALVKQWGAGNWSGSADERLRTLRGGLCLQDTGRRRFLIYGYFSTATPSAMVRVFQAYGCQYAMLLDMNALEHTYMALYAHPAGRIIVQHLIEGMAEVDRKGGHGIAPRFLSFPDDRDFFYLTRRE